MYLEREVTFFREQLSILEKKSVGKNENRKKVFIVRVIVNFVNFAVKRCNL